MLARTYLLVASTFVVPLVAFSGCNCEADRTDSTDLDIRALGLRRAVRGHQVHLSDDEVAFIHQSLRDSDSSYTEEGLVTYVEWELRAEVWPTPDQYRLMVSPLTEKVTASWELFIDRATGAVSRGMVATPPPELPDETERPDEGE